MMEPTLPFTKVFHLDRLRPQGDSIMIEADETARRSIAEAYQLPDIAALKAELNVRPHWRDGVKVTGVVTASITQVCGVSLEPFPANVRQDVEIVFSPSDKDDAEAVDDMELPDPLEGNTLDLGAIALEFFALGLDPYPRKSGVSFTPHIEQEDANNPFKALADLKDKKGG